MKRYLVSYETKKYGSQHWVNARNKNEAKAKSKHRGRYGLRAYRNLNEVVEAYRSKAISRFDFEILSGWFLVEQAIRENKKAGREAYYGWPDGVFSDIDNKRQQLLSLGES